MEKYPQLRSLHSLRPHAEAWRQQGGGGRPGTPSPKPSALPPAPALHPSAGGKQPEQTSPPTLSLECRLQEDITASFRGLPRGRLPFFRFCTSFSCSLKRITIVVTEPHAHGTPWSQTPSTPAQASAAPVMFAHPSIPLASGKDKSERAKRTLHVTSSVSPTPTPRTTRLTQAFLQAGCFPRILECHEGSLWSHGPIPSFQTGVQAK